MSWLKDDHITALLLVVIGCVMVVCGQSEVGMLITGGGLAVLKPGTQKP